MGLLQTLRKIRACEGEAAAQLLLEKIIHERVAEELEACAASCEDANTYDEDDPGSSFAAIIRRRS